MTTSTLTTEMETGPESLSEAGGKRAAFLIIALVFTAGLWFFLFSFLAPAPGRFGVDENAYLVGGKLIAAHGSPGFKPGDDYQFVGAMWLRTDSGWYYPKYPFGTSLLYALAILLGRREFAFAVSPICTCLAVLGMFFLSRRIVGSFYALLAMFVLAMCPTTLQLAILPNSHAPALCFVVWGMYFLLHWWDSGRWPIGLLAGLLLGYAVTVRYTEALLLFPLYSLEVIRTDQFIGPKLVPILKAIGFLPLGAIGIAAISRIKWKSPRSYLSAAVPVIAWAVPIGSLVLFNWLTMKRVTGYDSTNESSGFSMRNLLEKWDFATSQIYLPGLFLFAPLGVAGLMLMYARDRRTALALTLWFVPGALLYTSYYWGRNLPDIAFLRFFLTLFPPLIIAAMHLLRSVRREGAGSIASPLAAGILTAIAAAVGLSGSLDELVRQHRGNMNFHYTARQIESHIQPSRAGRPIILADEGMLPSLLQYLQFMIDADWYATDVFAPRTGGGFGLFGVLEKRKSTDDSPVVLQQARIDHIDAFRKGKTDPDFIRDARSLFTQALDSGRHVYVVLAPGKSSTFQTRFITKDFQLSKLDRWDEPCIVSFPNPGEQNQLIPSVSPDNEFFPWHRQRREMFEIRRSQNSRAPSTTRQSAGIAN